MPTFRPRARLSLAALLAPLAACATGGGSAALPAPVPLAIDAPAVLPLAGASLPLHAIDPTPRTRVRWSATPLDRAWIAPDGTLTLLEPGDVTVRVSDGQRQGMRPFVVQANPAARVVMQQRVVGDAAVGDTVRIVGHVYDAAGTRIPDAPVSYGLVVRGASPAAASVTADGRFVAAEPGVYTVLAACGRVSGRTIVIVESDEDRFARELVAGRLQAAGVPAAGAPVGAAPGGPPQLQHALGALKEHHPPRAPAIDSARAPAAPMAPAAPAAPHALDRVTVSATATTRVTLDDGDAAPYEGTTLTLTARVWVAGQGRPDTTAQVVWTSSDPDRAYVTQRGRVVFLEPGPVTITATHGGVVAARRFVVAAHPAVRVALRPSTADVVVGEPVRFREDAWQPGAEPVVDGRANYAIIAHGVTGPVPATLTERRVFTAMRPGAYTIIAEVGGVADRITLLVREGAVATR